MRFPFRSACATGLLLGALAPVSAIAQMDPPPHEIVKPKTTEPRREQQPPRLDDDIAREAKRASEQNAKNDFDAKRSTLETAVATRARAGLLAQQAVAAYNIAAPNNSLPSGQRSALQQAARNAMARMNTAQNALNTARAKTDDAMRKWVSKQQEDMTAFLQRHPEYKARPRDAQNAQEASTSSTSATTGGVAGGQRRVVAIAAASSSADGGTVLRAPYAGGAAQGGGAPVGYTDPRTGQPQRVGTPPGYTDPRSLLPPQRYNDPRTLGAQQPNPYADPATGRQQQFGELDIASNGARR